MNNGWLGQIIEAVADGTALSNSTVETGIVPAYCKWILDAGFFKRPGDEIIVEAAGRVSNIVTTPGTLTLKIKLGSVTVWDSGAIQLNAVAKTNVPWRLRVPLTCRAVGAGVSANLLGIGEFQSESVVGSPLPSAGGNGVLLVPVGAPAVGTGFDSTAAQTIDLTATFSIADAGNAIQCHQFRLQSLN